MSLAHGARRSGWHRALYGVALALIAAAIVLALALFGFRVIGWGSVSIVNKTTEPVAAGVVEVFRRHYMVPAMPPGSSHRITYWFDGEGSSIIVVMMKSGRLICAGDGYIDPLLRADDVFVVTSKGIYLNEPKNLQGPNLCADYRAARDLADSAGWRPPIGAVGR